MTAKTRQEALHVGPLTIGAGDAPALTIDPAAGLASDPPDTPFETNVT